MRWPCGGLLSVSSGRWERDRKSPTRADLVLFMLRAQDLGKIESLDGKPLMVYYARKVGDGQGNQMRFQPIRLDFAVSLWIFHTRVVNLKTSSFHWSLTSECSRSPGNGVVEILNQASLVFYWLRNRGDSFHSVAGIRSNSTPRREIPILWRRHTLLYSMYVCISVYAYIRHEI